MLRCVVKKHKQLHNSALCEPKLFLTQLPRLICTLRPALPFVSLPRFLMNISCEVSYKLWGLLQLALWGRMAKPAFSSLALIIKQRLAQTAGKAFRQLRVLSAVQYAQMISFPMNISLLSDQNITKTFMPMLTVKFHQYWSDINISHLS